MTKETVLVTGGSGFLGAHCVVAMLRAGYSVRATIRDPKREAEVRKMVSDAGIAADGQFGIAIADLTSDDGWPEAVAGCTYVLHVASPFPLGVPKDEDELIVPAREGTLRVLRAARDAGVKRVVLTSSFAAIGYGHDNRATPYTEKDWSNLDADLQPYVKSKTLAESAAWDFIETEGGGMELSVVNPVGIFGPALGADIGTSLEMLFQVMTGAYPLVPKIRVGSVDVRDVADLHLLAMTSPKAAGERFLACTTSIGMAEAGQIIRDQLGPDGARAPTRTMPDSLVRILSLFNSEIRQIAGELGKYREADNTKARSVLGWKPRSAEEAILAGARSLVAIRKSKDRQEAA